MGHIVSIKPSRMILVHGIRCFDAVSAANEYVFESHRRLYVRHTQHKCVRGDYYGQYYQGRKRKLFRRILPIFQRYFNTQNGIK